MDSDKILLGTVAQQQGNYIEGMLKTSLNIKPYSKIALKSAQVRFLPQEEDRNFIINEVNNTFTVNISGILDPYVVTLAPGTYTAYELRRLVVHGLNNGFDYYDEDPDDRTINYYTFAVGSPLNHTVGAEPKIPFIVNATKYVNEELLDNESSWDLDSGVISAINNRISPDSSNGFAAVSLFQMPLASGEVYLEFKGSGTLTGNEVFSCILGIGTVELYFDNSTSGDFAVKVNGSDVTQNDVAYSLTNTVSIVWYGTNLVVRNIDPAGDTIIYSGEFGGWDIDEYVSVLLSAEDAVNGGNNTVAVELSGSLGGAADDIKTKFTLTFSDLTLANYLGFKELVAESSYGRPAVLSGGLMSGGLLPGRILVMIEGLPASIKNYDGTMDDSSNSFGAILDIVDNLDTLINTLSVNNQQPSEFAFAMNNKFDTNINRYRIVFKNELTGYPLKVDKNSSVTLIIYQK